MTAMDAEKPSNSAGVPSEMSTADSNSGLAFSTFLTKDKLVKYCANYKSPIPNLMEKYVTIKKLGQGAFG